MRPKRGRPKDPKRAARSDALVEAMRGGMSVKKAARKFGLMPGTIRQSLWERGVSLCDIRRGMTKAEFGEKLRKWFAEGLSDREIGKRVNLKARAVGIWRCKLRLLKKRGLPKGYRQKVTVRLIEKVKKAFERGESLARIARRHGVTRQYVSLLAKQVGISAAERRTARAKARAREVEKMRIAGMTCKEAAAALGIHVVTLHKLKKRFDIPGFKRKKLQDYYEKWTGRCVLVAEGKRPAAKLPWKTRARVVMEKKLGRKLKKSEHVVHKNGVLNDDRPGNLKVVPAGTTRTYYKKRGIKIKTRKKKGKRKGKGG